MAVPKRSNVSKKKKLVKVFVNYVNICNKGHKTIKQLADGLFYSRTQAKFCKFCLEEKL